MQLDAQAFLRLAEKAGTLLFWDLETTGRDGEYHSILVSSFKRYGEAPRSLKVRRVGNDKNVTFETCNILDEADAIVTYYGKGFDLKFLNSRALTWGAVPPSPPKHHIDLYFSVRTKLLLGRGGQGHIAEWMNLKVKKMSVSPSVWSRAAYDPESMPILIQRCESDVTGLEVLYDATKHLIRDITR